MWPQMEKQSDPVVSAASYRDRSRDIEVDLWRFEVPSKQQIA